jgi:hypothetical protein
VPHRKLKLKIISGGLLWTRLKIKTSRGKESHGVLSLTVPLDFRVRIKREILSCFARKDQKSHPFETQKRIFSFIKVCPQRKIYSQILSILDSTIASLPS